jgi:two-component system, chemotaxis family, CheB/CheR fusion protein
MSNAEQHTGAPEDEGVEASAQSQPAAADAAPGPIAIIVALESAPDLASFIEQLEPSPDLTLVVYLVADAAGVPAVELADNYAGRPVVHPESGHVLTPGEIVILRAASAWVIEDGQLVVTAKERERRAPLNAFLRSLAREHVHQIAVALLTNVDGDGGAGLHAIREVGGVILADEALQRGHAGLEDRRASSYDRLIPRSRMPAALLDGLIRFRANEHPSGVALTSETESCLDRILALVRTRTGHDFRQYKRNTIVRRVERRMRVAQVDTLAAYLEHVRSTPAESELLLQDMLIGVTHFFRDAEAFELLAQEIIPKILSQKAPGSTVRIWAAGCATGEEAYSLAFLFTDHIAQHDLDLKLQVFATDIDEEALRVARRGAYPAAVELDIPRELLRRYLESSEGYFIVSKRIRDSVIFSSHNVIRDPPFSKLDLISCRNLLIYLSAELQSRLLPLFHYALNPGGYLVLGPAEGLGAGSVLFSVLHKKQRIFQRRELPMATPHMHFALPERREEARRVLQRLPPFTMDTPLPSLIERVLLQTYAPACVVINEKLEIVYFLGKTNKYLQPPEGVPTVNLLQMARADLRTQLRACVHQAMSQHQTATREGVEIKTDAGFVRVQLVVRPVSELGKDGLYLVLFQEEGGAAMARGEPDSDERGTVDPALEQLELELKRTQSQLQTVVEEFETSNEELKSSNEELLSMNEELQSSNEELETAKEELQSVNEELETVNSELKSKVDELAHANSDIRNLFENTHIAVLFLDNDLRINNFTPVTTELFRLIDTDRGRPIGHIAQRFHYEYFQRDVIDVIRQLRPQETHVQSLEGAWFIMRILPYRSLENVIEGAVVTFTDVSELKHAELEIQRLNAASERQLRWLKAITDVVPVGIAYAENGKPGVQLNPAAVQLLSLPEESLQADGESLPYLAWPKGDPDLRHAPLHYAITHASPARDTEIEIGSGGGLRHLVLNSAALVDASRAAYGRVSAFWDITEIKRAREQAMAREQQQALIAELGIAGLTDRNLDAFLMDGLRRLCQAAHGDMCEMMQVSSATLELKTLSRLGFRVPDTEVVERLTPNSPTHLALLRGEPVFFQRSSDGADGADWPNYFHTEGVQSGVRIAISCNGREPFGLLGIYSREQREFPKADLDFLRAVALVITSAVQRRLLEEGRLREREAAAVRRSEEQLRRAERLASLGTFAAGIAHELNNPLNNISLAADYAESSDDVERRNKLLEAIKANAQRCGRIVESVLRFARDEVTERWPVDINSVIRRSVDLMRAELGPDHLTMKLNLGNDLPSISGNAMELEQVFVNLLRNAVEAHPGHCHVEIQSLLAEPYLRVIISDDGPGIPESDLGRVFDPFFSTRRKQGGSGLGLSITHRIITGHGGLIQVGMEKGGGATFSIELPLDLKGSQ